MTDDRDPSLTEADILRENAYSGRIGSYRHIAAVLGHEKDVLPNIYDETHPAVLQLHDTLKSVPDLPHMDADAIEDRMIRGFMATERRSGRPQRNFKSIDGVISYYKTSAIELGRMNQIGLNTLDQILISRAVMIAANSRIAVNDARYSSEVQKKLFLKARNNIRHFATNPIRIPDEHADNQRIEEFGTRYAASFLAQSILGEMELRGIELQETSIRDVLSARIPFADVLSGTKDETLSIFNRGPKMPRPENTNGLREKDITELDPERINDLKAIASSLGGIGKNTYHIYETYSPFVEADGTRQPKGGDKPPKPPTGPEGPDDIEEEAGSYLLIVIRRLDAEGNASYDVIADNPEKGNALYVLRHEVLDGWKTLTGMNITWRQIFSYKRKVARQLGARPFIHTEQNRVKERAISYLNQEAESLVNETFGKILDPASKLFDKKLRPTDRNLMPKQFIEALQKSDLVRELWPMIQSYGYVDTMFLIKSELGLIPDQPTTTETDKEPHVSAADILQGIINTRLSSR